MKLLDNALEIFKEQLKNVPEGTSTKDADSTAWDNHYRGVRSPNESTVRLRLDWELAENSIKDKDEIYDLMVTQIKGDLEDLIVDGDENNRTDVLLKSMNGSRVRQKEPVAIKFLAGTLVSAPRSKKKIVDYTLYLVLHVTWDNDNKTVS